MTRLRRWTVALIVAGIMGAANTWMGVNANATNSAARSSSSAVRGGATTDVFRPDAGADSFR